MSYIAHRVVRQHGFLVAFVSAAVVLAVLIVQTLASVLISQLDFLDSGSSQGIQWWAYYGPQLAMVALPFAIGVLLSLWFIAPIATELHVAHVITRSLLAAAVGAVLALLVTFVVSLVGLLSGGGLMSNLMLTRFSGETILSIVRSAVSTGAREFVSSAPLVILVGVLLWIWLEQHPSKHPVSGIVDQA
jgi:hypothetical protein